MCTTIKGKVWTRARTNIVQLIQRWKTWSFSWEMPVRTVIQFTLDDAILYFYQRNTHLRHEVFAYITNGSNARDIHPDLVARGGEPPNENFFVFGQ
jgi:hypothetical protein